MTGVQCRPVLVTIHGIELEPYEDEASSHGFGAQMRTLLSKRSADQPVSLCDSEYQTSRRVFKRPIDLRTSILTSPWL